MLPCDAYSLLQHQIQFTHNVCQNTDFSLQGCTYSDQPAISAIHLLGCLHAVVGIMFSYKQA